MVKVVLLSLVCSLSILSNLVAQSSVDTLLAKLDYATHDTTRLSVLNQLCHVYRPTDPAKSVDIGTQAYQLAKKLGDKSQMAEACYCMGIAQWIQSNYDTALTNLQQSLKLSTETSDSAGVARSYSVMGIVYRNIGDHLSALEYQNKALVLYHALGQKQGIIKAYSNIGAVYYKQGSLAEALENYLKALEISITLSDKKQTASIYNNIGLVCSDRQQSDEAIAYFVKAKALQEEIGNARGVADIHVNMASIFCQQKDIAKALETYEQARQIYQNLGDEQGEGAVLLGIGKTYYKQQNNQQALSKYESALQIFKQIGYQDGIASTLNAMAQIYLHQKKYAVTIQLAQKAVHIAEELPAASLIQQSAKLLYKGYEGEENYQEAFQYLLMHEHYKDSIINEENSEKIAQLKFDYELAQKAAENKALKAQNDLQARQVGLQKTLRNVFVAGFLVTLGLAIGFLKGKYREKKAKDLLSRQHEKIKALASDLKSVNVRISEHNQDLEKLNKSKDRLFSVISHDLRSPLNSLYGLLTLLQHDNLSPEEIQQMVPEIAEQLINSHNLLDNLLVWAKSQMQGLGPVIQTIYIHQLVDETMALMQVAAEKKAISLHNNTSNTAISADANMIKLVLRNLISNAIKFTPEHGRIMIDTEKTTGNHLQITVRDTGVGIDRHILKKLFKEVQYSATGTQGEKGTGLGLLLSKDFIEQNGGKIWADSHKGRGSTFRFTVPISDTAQT